MKKIKIKLRFLNYKYKNLNNKNKTFKKQSFINNLKITIMQTNETKNAAKNENSKNVEVSKIESLLILKSNLGLKNNSNNSKYNYSKIVENIKDLNILFNLGLTEKFIIDLQKDKQNFISEKTKNGANQFYEKLKKQIRNNVQKINTLCANAEKNNDTNLLQFKELQKEVLNLVC